MLLAPVPGGPGAQNGKNMESEPGSYSDRALCQVGVWALVFSPVNFEPGSRSASAARLSTQSRCSSPWTGRPRQPCGPGDESCFYNGVILTRHVVSSGLLVLPQGSHLWYRAPHCWRCFSLHTPVPRPWSSLPLTTHFHRSSGTNSDASSLVDALFRFLA